MPMKRHKRWGKNKTHADGSGSLIHVKTDASPSLRLHEADPLPTIDERNSLSLWQRVGWISDDHSDWKLWFLGDATRKDKIESDYPLSWIQIEYADGKARKKTGDLTTVAPHMMNPILPSITQRDAKFVESLPHDTQIPRSQLPRFLRLLNPHVSGVHLLIGWQLPRFQIQTSDVPRIRIEPFSTARVIFRILERVMMRGSKTNTIKDSDIEPFLVFLQFLGAMDYDGLGKSIALCGAAYVKAFGVAIPEPFRSLILPDFAVAVAAQKGPRLRKDELAMDVDSIRELVKNGCDEDVIFLQQIQVDLIGASALVIGTAASDRRLPEKLRKLGVELVRVRGVGLALLLKEYRRAKPRLLVRGNTRPSK